MTNETKKKQVAEQIWLHYFNDTLYKKSIITELERNKMAILIENSKPKQKNSAKKER